MKADSIASPSPTAAEHPTPRELHIEEIFGSQSERVTYTHTTQQQPTHPHTPQEEQHAYSLNTIELTAVLTLLIYSVWIAKLIYHRRRGDYTEERWIYGDREMREYERVSIAMSDIIISMGLMLGLVLMLLQIGMSWASVADAEMWGAGAHIFIQASEVLRAVSFERAIAIIATYLVSTTILIGVIYFISSRLSLRSEWVRLIIRLKAQSIYPIMLYIMPFVLFLSLDSGNKVLGYIVLFEVVAAIIIYIIRSFLLFVSQKISILQWFLYLCTVEILPISLVWVFFVRSATLNS